MPLEPSEKQTYFLCPKHKKRFMENLDQAALAWPRFIKTARKKLVEQQWKQSVIYYGNAFETADILFSYSEKADEINRYIETAIELIYALRHSHYVVNFDYLINEVNDTIQQRPLSTHPKFVIKPLKDIAFSPLEIVERRINITSKLGNRRAYQRPVAHYSLKASS